MIKKIEYYFDQLFPLNRSITGKDYQKSLNILSKIIPLKKIADEAFDQCPNEKKCVVVERTGNQVNWNEERDVSYKKLISIKIIINEYLKASNFFIDDSQTKYLNALLDKISKKIRISNE